MTKRFICFVCCLFVFGMICGCFSTPQASDYDELTGEWETSPNAFPLDSAFIAQMTHSETIRAMSYVNKTLQLANLDSDDETKKRLRNEMQLLLDHLSQTKMPSLILEPDPEEYDRRARIPDPLDPTLIAQMSEDEARSALTDVTEGLQHVARHDDETKRRLRNEMRLLLDRLKALSIASSTIWRQEPRIHVPLDSAFIAQMSEDEARSALADVAEGLRHVSRDDDETKKRLRNEMRLLLDRLKALHGR